LKLPNRQFLKQLHSEHGLMCGTTCWLEALVDERLFNLSYLIVITHAFFCFLV
jgi:hypothetical protein